MVNYLSYCSPARHEEVCWSASSRGAGESSGNSDETQQAVPARQNEGHDQKEEGGENRGMEANPSWGEGGYG